MIFTVSPGSRTGAVRIPASKSQAHRLLICAALADGETVLERAGTSEDIEATARCLRALGARVQAQGAALRVAPRTAALPVESVRCTM